MFDSNRKKTFHSQALNRLTVLERLTWLIPVGFIVREIIYTHSEIEEVLHDSPSPAVIIALIIAILLLPLCRPDSGFCLQRCFFILQENRLCEITPLLPLSIWTITGISSPDFLPAQSAF